jgi:CheY-like chemotaxis protein
LKKALIVDDSRLARAALSKLLVEHGVAADTAESAEVALEYLKHSRPDVVFLDHLMPGLDGFQALDAIKKNPATATIPVMMYTSQEGELYLGQARALGALGVLPKTLQPAEVGRVLRSLHLIPPAEPAAGSEPPKAPAGEPVPPAPKLRPLDAEQLRTVLAELFEEQGSTLRAELRREWQRFVASGPPALASAAAPLEPPPSRASARPFKIATALLLVVCATLGYLYFVASSSLELANGRAARLAGDMAVLTAARAGAPPRAAAPGAGLADALDVLEWGLNRGGRYPFGAIGLDDERANLLEGLVARLAKLDFAGTITFDVYAGRFCMNYAPDGTLELAAPEQPAATCERVGLPETDAVALGKQESRAFANAVATATADNPLLTIETVSHGSAEPAVQYPVADYGLTAGAWNAVAAANQRVSVHLVAASRSTAAP